MTTLSRVISDLIDPVARLFGVRERLVFGLEITPDSLDEFRSRMRSFAATKPGYKIEERDTYRYWCRLESAETHIRVEPRCLEVASGEANSKPLHSETEYVVYMHAMLVWTPLSRIEQSFTSAALSAPGVRKLPEPPPPSVPRRRQDDASREAQPQA
jgi:hypothetical protein